MLCGRSGTLSTAESCTGGMIAQRITSVPGASRYYLGGFVTYSNDAKVRGLLVPLSLIERCGAVSGEVAAAMAEGAKDRTGSDYALAVTGIAGPEGGTKEKPVGLVWVAVASGEKPVVTRRFEFQGQRETIRRDASEAALGMLMEILSPR